MSLFFHRAAVAAAIIFLSWNAVFSRPPPEPLRRPSLHRAFGRFTDLGATQLPRAALLVVSGIIALALLSACGSGPDTYATQSAIVQERQAANIAEATSEADEAEHETAVATRVALVATIRAEATPRPTPTPTRLDIARGSAEKVGRHDIGDLLQRHETLMSVRPDKTRRTFPGLGTRARLGMSPSATREEVAASFSEEEQARFAEGRRNAYDWMQQVSSLCSQTAALLDHVVEAEEDLQGAFPFRYLRNDSFYRETKAILDQTYKSLLPVLYECTDQRGYYPTVFEDLAGWFEIIYSPDL